MRGGWSLGLGVKGKDCSGMWCAGGRGAGDFLFCRVGKIRVNGSD